MKLGSSDDVHLCYCSNVHPGETWLDVRSNLDRYVRAVKDRVLPGADFGIGLRLSDGATRTLADPTALDELRRWLSETGMYVFTVNAFPYGAFHGQPVKEQVYLPDWLMRERLEYANRSAEILAALLPEAIAYGSVSTVPGAYRPRAGDRRRRLAIAQLLGEHAVHLSRLADRTGRMLVCGLEPEPACMLESTSEAVEFLEDCCFRGEVLRRFAEAAGGSVCQAEERLRSHLGLCLDACHAAVGFEEPEAVINQVQQAGIRVAKLQVSAGLRVLAEDFARLSDLRAFDEGVYLHQVVARDGASLRRFDDLPEACTAAAASAPAPSSTAEWRVHFHVPVFAERLGPFHTTQATLREFLGLQRRLRFTAHLEVETYSWGVLPERYRAEGVVAAVARELEWTLGRLSP